MFLYSTAVIEMDCKRILTLCVCVYIYLYMSIHIQVQMFLEKAQFLWFVSSCT